MRGYRPQATAGLNMRDHVRFFLNDQERVVRGGAAFLTLAEWLRLELGLVGTKIVCAEGDCGACTVLIGRSKDGGLQYYPIDSCIQFVVQIDGAHVVTVEGLASNGEAHAVQQALVERHGSQCGYCTPGFVMALAGWAENGARLHEARIGLTGNLCRCTGYVPILQAADSLAANPPTSIKRRLSDDVRARLHSFANDPLGIDGEGQSYFAPASLAEAVAYKSAHQDAVIIAGATELGVWRNKRDYTPTRYLCLNRIAELSSIEQTPSLLEIGANVTWSQIEERVRDVLPEFYRIIQRFGSPQIRNTATLVGNVANGSPIADSLPLLAVMDATLEVVGPRGSRQCSINGFYTGYKVKDLAADELIVRVRLPLPAAHERLRLYKVSRRNDLDIATFGAAIRMTVVGDLIESAAIAYAGVAATVVRLPRTEEWITGLPFDEATLRAAGRVARNEVAPITDVRGTADFRWQLCENVLTKFYFDEAHSVLGAMA